MIPTSVISNPEAHQDLDVISDFAAPTTKCATMLTAKATITAANPPMKKNGMIGMNAPTAVDVAADSDDFHGLGKCRSDNPSSCCAIICTICSGFSAIRTAMRLDSSSPNPWS